MLEAVIEGCAGINVGKKFVVVCLMVGSLASELKTELRKFGTIWKPIFNVLESDIKVILANAFDGRNRRGH